MLQQNMSTGFIQLCGMRYKDKKFYFTFNNLALISQRLIKMLELPSIEYEQEKIRGREYLYFRPELIDEETMILYEYVTCKTNENYDKIKKVLAYRNLVGIETSSKSMIIVHSDKIYVISVNEKHITEYHDSISICNSYIRKWFKDDDIIEFTKKIFKIKNLEDFASKVKRMLESLCIDDYSFLPQWVYSRILILFNRYFECEPDDESDGKSSSKSDGKLNNKSDEENNLSF